MYLEHFQLKSKPFQISADPKFLWLGENHKEALAILRYGILDNRGFLLLTGDVGTGKTTLINALLNGLGDEAIAAMVPDPGLSTMDFFNYIAGAFGIKKRFAGKGDFLFYFRYFLDQAYQKNKKVLLIIDESQRLTHELLEEIRLLSNIEKQNQKLINIFFIGQNEFNDLLWEPRNRALRQRITINYNVYALTEQEVSEYIRHRLRIAGTEKTIFTVEAIKEIMAYSEGFPRMINVICDHALLTGFVKGVTIVGPGVIRECIADLQIPRKKEEVEEKPRKAPILEPPLETPLIESQAKSQPEKTPHRMAFTQRVAMAAIALVAVCTVIYFFLSGPNSYLQSMTRYWRILIGASQKIQVEAFKSDKQEADNGKIVPAGRPEGPLRQPVPVRTEEDAVIKKSIVDKPVIDTGVAGKSASIPQESETFHTSNVHSVDSGIKASTQVAGEDSIPLRLIGTGKSVIQQGAISFSRENKMKPGRTNVTQRTILNFTHNSNELSKEATDVLDRTASILMNDPASSLSVVGYTDSSGVYGYNKNLSLFRANIVKSYLVGKGVNPVQVTAIGMGPENPMDDNTTAQGRKTNRRVEIELAKTQSPVSP